MQGQFMNCPCRLYVKLVFWDFWTTPSGVAIMVAAMLHNVYAYISLYFSFCKNLVF